MKNLIIIGAGGCGREVLQWAKDINKAEPRWNIKGFIDDSSSALEGKDCSVEIISGIDDYEIMPDDEFLCCIGTSDVREEITERLKSKGAVFTTLVHPTAVIADTCTLGEGVIIYPYALISDNAKIGAGCIINMHSTVAHDSVLGDYCTVSAHCDITGACTLGKRVFLGTTAHVVPGTSVGDGAYICAGSTVMTRLRPGTKVLGNPAKIVKF